jgi:hypothetical protein
MILIIQCKKNKCISQPTDKERERQTERDRERQRERQNLTPSNAVYHIVMQRKKERELLNII